MNQFEIKNLTFSYPERDSEALSGVSLSVEAGDFVVICGKSGCGKSTLLRHLKTVLTPFGKRSGEILFDGRALENVEKREQTSRIGFVHQSPENQIVTDKVWHELAFGLESLGEKTPVIRRRVAEMASFFGIQEWYEKSVFELSGGQKQLLALAAVLAMQPDVLILDEPTAQLDPIAAEDFMETLKKINDEIGTTLIMSEHRLEGAVPRADRLIVMAGGRIVCEGTSSEAARKLKEKDDPMLSAMPTPTRVFLALEDERHGDGSSVLAGREHKRDGSFYVPGRAGRANQGDGAFDRQEGGVFAAFYGRVPQTVREGRLYLEQSFKMHGDGVDEVDYQENRKGVDDFQNERPFIAQKSGNVRIQGRIIDENHVFYRKNQEKSYITVDLCCERAELQKSSWQQAFQQSTTSCPQSPLVELKDVWFRYEREGPDVVKDLALSVYPGEFLCVVGGNGTGKSTMLGVVSGENKYYRGRANTLGFDPKKAGGKVLSEAGLAALPQDPQTLFTRATVFDNLVDVAFACAKRRGENPTPEEIEIEVRRVCALTDTTGLMGFHPYDVSGGEQQRTGLSMALLTRPKLLLLDEPTKGMDGFFKVKFSEILRNLCRSGMGVLMVSHDVEFCAKYADRCALFFNGGVVSEGEPRRFFSGNSFYTTAANRMARGLFPDAITAEEVIELCLRDYKPSVPSRL